MKCLVAMTLAVALSPQMVGQASAQSQTRSAVTGWGHYALLVENGYWGVPDRRTYWRYLWATPGRALRMRQYSQSGEFLGEVLLTRNTNGTLRRSDAPGAVSRVLDGKIVTQSAGGFNEIVMQPGNKAFKITTYPNSGQQPRSVSYVRISDNEFRRRTASRQAQSGTSARAPTQRPQRAEAVSRPPRPRANPNVDPARFLTEVCAPYVLRDRTPGGWTAAVDRAARQGYRVDYRDGTYATLKRGEHEIKMQYFTEFQKYDRRTIVITDCELRVKGMTEAQMLRTVAPAVRALNIRRGGEIGWSVGNFGRQISFHVDNRNSRGVYLGGGGTGVYLPADGSVATSVSLKFSNKFFK